MNILLLSSGIFAFFTMIGHLLIGQKLFLVPMLNAEFSLSAKKVMHSVFHYVSIFLLLSSVGLLIAGLGVLPVESAKSLSLFIALNYLLFAIWQIVIALNSGIKKPLLKLFQWIFFVIIAFFAFAGAFVL
ncbi:hypothetical protein GCM10007916_24830 [Psychromonas marina]|uniref:DUF423 domain-containing protein n=1 Tax=Psychromonas marina TaxID=88364 RepID=A0ABQ6E1V1_9GAMM|nr:hypothetical protein [Psychromonas marina]GLS91414.1 hypothetical protein GCM10007916_24830 [Psychromonas marina]